MQRSHGKTRTEVTEASPKGISVLLLRNLRSFPITETTQRIHRTLRTKSTKTSLQHAKSAAAGWQSPCLRERSTPHSRPRARHGGTAAPHPPPQRCGTFRSFRPAPPADKGRARRGRAALSRSQVRRGAEGPCGRGGLYCRGCSWVRASSPSGLPFGFVISPYVDLQTPLRYRYQPLSGMSL